MAYCTQAQFETACGGAADLLALAAKAAGAVDVNDADYLSFSSECMEDGSAELASLLGVQYTPSSIQAPFDRALANHAAGLASWWAWSKGAGGRAMPPEIDRNRAIAMEWAHAAAGRTGVLNQIASKAQPVKHLDPDPDGRHISRRGFKRGGFQ